MIRFEAVSKQFANGHLALDDVSFEVNRGELVFLTGHSGAGKSTLLKLLLLIERATSGEIWVDSRRLDKLKSRHIPGLRRRVGVVFQNPHLLYDRSVYDNIALPLLIEGYSPKEAGRRIRAALDKVGLLHCEKQNPHVLSGGEQQRIGIARAIVNKPRMLIADEPTGNLDPDLSSEIMELFQQFSAVGVTVLVATHDISLIRQMQRRVLHLEQGQLIADEFLAHVD